MSHLVFETRDEACYGLKGDVEKDVRKRRGASIYIVCSISMAFVAKNRMRMVNRVRHCAAVKCLFDWRDQKNAKRQ